MFAAFRGLRFGTGRFILIGASPAFLWMAADNPRAERFYRRNGFTPDGATDRYLMLGTHVDIVRLVR